MTFSREWAINILKGDPNTKITHSLFDSNEYIYGKDGLVFDENGLLFEDWTSDGPNKHNGIRMRIGGPWEYGWSFYNKENIKHE